MDNIHDIWIHKGKAIHLFAVQVDGWILTLMTNPGSAFQG